MADQNLPPGPPDTSSADPAHKINVTEPPTVTPAHHRAMPRAAAESLVVHRRKRPAKLDAAKVRSIRALADAGIPQAKIGELYRIGQPQISAIINRKAWAHVT